MRRRASFDTALTAADTGHMVMSTLHTASASQTIQRVLDFYPEEERKQVRLGLASNLGAIISQRLLPRIGGAVAPAIEIMINTPMVRKLLEEDQLGKLANAIEAGRPDGMQSFNHSLLGLVQSGIVEEEVALEKATNREQLSMNLKGIFLSSGNAILG